MSIHSFCGCWNLWVYMKMSIRQHEYNKECWVGLIRAYLSEEINKKYFLRRFVLTFLIWLSSFIYFFLLCLKYSEVDQISLRHKNNPFILIKNTLNLGLSHLGLGIECGVPTVLLFSKREIWIIPYKLTTSSLGLSHLGLGIEY